MVMISAYTGCCGARIISGFSIKPDAAYPKAVSSSYRQPQLVARPRREDGKRHAASGYVARDYAYFSNNKWQWYNQTSDYRGSYSPLTKEELEIAKLTNGDDDDTPKKTYGDRLKELVASVGYDGKSLIECILNEGQIKLGWLPYLKEAGFECTRSWINGVHGTRLYRFDVVPNKTANKEPEPKGWAALEKLAEQANLSSGDADAPIDNPFAAAA